MILSAENESEEGAASTSDRGRRRKVKDRDSFTDFHPNSLCGGGKRDCHRMTLALPLHSLLSMSGTRDTDPRFARDGSDHADPIPTANETNICDHCCVSGFPNYKLTLAHHMVSMLHRNHTPRVEMDLISH
ncbi:hypothetical protein RRG08_002863 [Elysia crispata]|uniref:Uncharacterized protein n=1 Tax=Elysia crispata TaxID=231223 RepID=A0AAE0XU75_9GAST|nr:hypothetical protein RRG08_002863 [Elysia crispata]